MTHAISWFEIPSIDFDRAVKFYSTVLDREIDVYNPEPDETQNGRAGMFQTDDGEVGGMIVETDEYTTDSGTKIPYAPTADSGLVIYLSVDGDLDDALSQIEQTGGEVLVPKESLPNADGHYAIVTDTEGNRVGLMTSE
jgi:predicted enzyme related to lactoylglutathione lyase